MIPRRFVLFSPFKFTGSLVSLFPHMLIPLISRDLTTSPIQLNWTLGYSYLAIFDWFLYLLFTSHYYILHNNIIADVSCKVVALPLCGCMVFLIARLFLVRCPCPNQGVVDINECQMKLNQPTPTRKKLPCQHALIRLKCKCKQFSLPSLAIEWTREPK